MTAARDAWAVLSALVLYERQVLPLARRELAGWERLAAEIPSPALRDSALSSLRKKRANVEATAVFAILAPRAGRCAALRAMVALQVAVDYLDTLGEQPAEDPLANGLALHEALGDALSPGTEPGDWYRLHAEKEDGGYLAALVAGCSGKAAALPAAPAALPLARRAARRCGEGQARTHAVPTSGPGQLEEWASRLDAPPGYGWWELAAGASSSVAAHALIAAAADPATTPAQAELVDAAYFPPVGALTVLLDDLVDREQDRLAAEHNYLDHYVTSTAAADAMGLIAGRAKAAMAPLRHAPRHRAILAGVAGFYLSADEASGEYAQPIRKRLLESLDPTVRPILAATRLRRRD